MRPHSEVEAVARLIHAGLNDCAIARATGIPRPTVREWRCNGAHPGHNRMGAFGPSVGGCPICGGDELDSQSYAYLLGMYLGDGYLASHPRNVFRLRIVLDARYPGIIDECARAMKAVRGEGGRVSFTNCPGCVEVGCYWKHWPCLFPQHGKGPKFRRTIELEAWQDWITTMYPDSFLRGLIHSDGCRDLERVNGKQYVRYSFANNSEDIRALFSRSCDDLRISWTHPYWKTISIARARDTTRLDKMIGPKR